MHQHAEFYHFMLFEVEDIIIVISVREVLKICLRVTKHVLTVVISQALSREHFVESLFFWKAPQFFENVLDVFFQGFFRFWSGHFICFVLNLCYFIHIEK